MNRADIALLDSSLNSLADTMLRQRAMKNQAAYQQAEIAERQLATQAAINRWHASEKHNEAMETLGLSGATNREEMQLEANKAAEARAAIAQKQDLLKTAITLNSSGQLDDDSRDDFNDWLSADEHFGGTGIQLAKPSSPAIKGAAQKQAAVGNALEQARQYRAEADEAESEEEAKQYLDYATMLENWVRKQGSRAAPSGWTETTTKDAMGLHTSKSHVPIGAPPMLVPADAGGPGEVPGGLAAPGAAASLPFAPADPAKRVKGQRYRSATNPGVLGVWTGMGWNTNAPATQAVPGFGNAQAPGGQQQQQ